MVGRGVSHKFGISIWSMLTVPQGSTDTGMSLCTASTHCVLEETVTEKTAHHLVCIRGGPVLKLICLSPFHRHIILFILKQHLLILPPSLSHPLAHSFIPIVCVWPWFQLWHYCTDAEVSGQGDKLENAHTESWREVRAPPSGQCVLNCRERGDALSSLSYFNQIGILYQ